ncbi:MAG: cache domain-containing protein, partial [Pseudomonadota bacterium]|nr:cache domain-containing protein [Pseudomonadota bacterium]
MKTVKSFAKTQLLGMILVALIPIVFLGGFFIYHELSTFHQEVGKIRGRQYEERKKMIKRRVDEALNFIHFKKSQQENEVRKTIQTRVYEAHALATHLHTVYADKKESEEIKEMVREALRPTRFNKGKGYFFATALDGVEQLFADRPALEGKNLLDLRDARGKYVIREMIALVKEQGEGFYNYHWSKP